MKLKEYILYHQKDVNKLIEKDEFLKNLEVEVTLSFREINKMNIMVDYELNDLEYYFELLVKIDILENNKNEIIKAMKLIINQIELGNYSCLEIKRNDKFGSISNNIVNNDEITLLEVYRESDLLYNKSHMNDVLN